MSVARAYRYTLPVLGRRVSVPRTDTTFIGSSCRFVSIARANSYTFAGSR